MSLFSRKSEEGSTLLEILAALLVLSLLGMGAWNAAAVSLRQAARINKKVRENAGLLQMDETLRGMAARVRAPFWAWENVVEIENGKAAVPYLDADPEKHLTLSFVRDALSVSDGETTMQFPGYESADFSEARAGRGRIYGLTVELGEKDGERLSITARFGGMPLEEAGAR